MAEKPVEASTTSNPAEPGDAGQTGGGERGLAAVDALVAVAAATAAAGAGIAAIAVLGTAPQLLHQHPWVVVSAIAAVLVVSGVAGWWTVGCRLQRLSTRDVVVGAVIAAISVGAAATALAIAHDGQANKSQSGGSNPVPRERNGPHLEFIASSNVGLAPNGAVSTSSGLITLLGTGASLFDPGSGSANMLQVPVNGAEYGAVIGSTLWTTDDGGTLRGHDVDSGHVAGHPYHYGERARPVISGFGRLWIANTDYSKIDPVTSSGTWLPPRAVPSHPTSVTTGFGSVWATLDTGEVVRLDPNGTGRVVINTGSTDSDALAATSTRMWVLHPRQGIASAIDPATNQATGQRISIGSDPQAFAADAKSLWVITVDPNNPEQTDVVRYAESTGERLGSLRLAGYPIAIQKVGDDMVVVTDAGIATAIRGT